MRARGPRALRVAVAAVLVAIAAGCGQSTGTASSGESGGRATVRVAAAADLKFAMDEVAAALVRSQPDIDLAVTYGSSGTFFQQLSNGAPFDVFLSADLSYPAKLAEAGKASNDDVFRYAVGRLVVWAPNGSPVDATRGLASLSSPEVTKVAIANPAHAPYGKAAVAAMQAAGVYDAVDDKLVLGENVAQAAEFAQSGNAQVGVFALSLALSSQLKDKGRFAEVPLESYPRLDQGGVVMGDARDPQAARRVKDFLLGEQGRAILGGYGFSEPGT
ncbi:MAG: molybdate ABC transporter substrate-binding protein [Acidimicrobiales bacterium]